MWVQIAVLAPLVLWAGTRGGIEPIAMATTAAAAIVLPFAAAVLSHTIGFTVAMILRSLWRPVLATALMVIVVTHIALPADLPALVRLIATVAVGGVVYVAGIGVCWLLAGRPEGLELAAWRTVRRFTTHRAA
jgi:hypothetical protein